MPDQQPAPPPAPSYFGLILTVGLLGMAVIWTYILFGIRGVGWWMKLAASVGLLAAVILGWRWRRQRDRQQIELLKRWADEDSAPPTRPGAQRP